MDVLETCRLFWKLACWCLSKFLLTEVHLTHSFIPSKCHKILGKKHVKNLTKQSNIPMVTNNYTSQHHHIWTQLQKCIKKSITFLVYLDCLIVHTPIGKIAQKHGMDLLKEKRTGHWLFLKPLLTTTPSSCMHHMDMLGHWMTIMWNNMK